MESDATKTLEAMAGGVMAKLKHTDGPTHDALCDAFPMLSAHLGPAYAWSAFIEGVAQLAAEDCDAALTLARRLSREPDMAEDPLAWRRWVLHGLSHRRDARRRGAHFRVSHPVVFSDAQAQSDATNLLACRDSLLHYVRGFGCTVLGIELLEPVAQGAGLQAPTVVGEVICMPRTLRPAEGRDRDRERLHRAAMSHIAAHLIHSPPARPSGNRRPMLLALMGLLEDARVERLMVLRFPGLEQLWGLYHTATKESAGFEFQGLAARLARALHDPAYRDPNDWVTKGRVAFEEAARRDLHDVDAFDRIARDLSIAMGRMRQQVPLGYRPTPLYRDDNAVLWNEIASAPVDEEAEPDIEVHTATSPEELTPQDELAQMDLRRRFVYPEWDPTLQALKESWCTVLEPARAAAVARSTAVSPRAQRRRLRGLERTPDRGVWLPRQREGEELDLNALIESAVQRRMGVAPDAQVFRQHGKRRRTTAVLLLMDLSVSTNRFVPGSFTTVLDAEKRAATVVARALDQRHDRVAIHGFSSNGRHEVGYVCVKDFGEPFDAPQQRRLASLSGDLSTRMGAALRHASAALCSERTDHKIILMLTDGEPSDVDVFEENYLVEDARHAVTTASSQGIHTFCLTLDRRADGYVRRIFGSRNYLIAAHADTFAGRAGDALVRLVAG